LVSATGRRERMSGWRTVDLESLAGGGLDPFSVDVAHVLLEEGRVFELLGVSEGCDVVDERV
jgi:hypothetical protein